MKHEVPMKSGDDYDAFTRWRRFLIWRAGEIKAIKRRFNKRARSAAKQQAREAKDVSE